MFHLSKFLIILTKTVTHKSCDTFLFHLYFIYAKLSADIQKHKYDAAKYICVFVTFLFKYVYLLCTLIEN